MRSAIIKRGSKTWETRSECINFGHEAAVGREKSNSGGRKNRIIHMQLAPEARRELACCSLVALARHATWISMHGQKEKDGNTFIKIRHTIILSEMKEKTLSCYSFSTL
jgi:hypothetical protein